MEKLLCIDGWYMSGRVFGLAHLSVPNLLVQSIAYGVSVGQDTLDQGGVVVSMCITACVIYKA